MVLAAEATTADPAAETSGFVVRRGDATVDMAMIDAYLSRIPADKRAGYMNDPERIEFLLQGLLVSLQLAHDAEQNGLADDPVTENVLRLMRAELLAKRRMNQVVDTLPEPDFAQLARERYLASPDAYLTEERRTLRHLVVMHRNHGVDGARKRAEELLQDFRASGKTFEEFVREHSEETTAKDDGGLLTAISGKDVDKGFYEAAFALTEKGQLTEPTMSRFGYHLIELVDIVPASRKAFDEVKDSIIADLRREYSTRARTEYLDNLKASATLEAVPELVASLRTRYLPDGEGTAVLKQYDAAQRGELPSAAQGQPVSAGDAADK